MRKGIIPIFIALMVLLCSCTGKKILVKQNVKAKPSEIFRIVFISHQGKVCVDPEDSHIVKIRFSKEVDFQSVNNKVVVIKAMNLGDETADVLSANPVLQKDKKTITVALWELPLIKPCHLLINPGIKSQSGLLLSDTASGKDKVVEFHYYSKKNISTDTLFVQDVPEGRIDPQDDPESDKAAEVSATLDKLQKQLSEMKEKTSELEKRSRK